MEAEIAVMSSEDRGRGCEPNSPLGAEKVSRGPPSSAPAEATQPCNVLILVLGSILDSDLQEYKVEDVRCPKPCVCDNLLYQQL